MLRRSTNLTYPSDGAQTHEGVHLRLHTQRPRCKAATAAQAALGPAVRTRVKATSIGPQAPPSQPAHPSEAPPVGSEEYHRQMLQRLRQQRAAMQEGPAAARTTNATTTSATPTAPANASPTAPLSNPLGSTAPHPAVAASAVVPQLPPHDGSLQPSSPTTIGAPLAAAAAGSYLVGAMSSSVPSGPSGSSARGADPVESGRVPSNVVGSAVPLGQQLPAQPAATVQRPLSPSPAAAAAAAATVTAGATPAPTRSVRRRSKSAAPALPDLLPGLNLNKQQPQRRTTTSGSTGGGGLGGGGGTGPSSTVVATSTRRPGGGDVFVGSTRSAKAGFAVVLPSQSPIPHTPAAGSTAAKRNDAAGKVSYFSSTAGVYGASAARGTTWPQNTAGGDGGITSTPIPAPAPMHRRSSLDLNPLVSAPLPLSASSSTALAAAASHSASAPIGAPISVPSAAAAAAPGVASRQTGAAGPMASGKSAGGGATIPVSSTALGAAGAAAVAPATPAAAAAAAALAAKKRPARPAALWMTSFMQAGMAAGTGGGAVGAAAAVAPARKVDPSGSKAAPPVDVSAAAAAMIRTAVELHAVDLAAAVKDLQTPIPELQARLESAVQAEQESERRALRALYALGSLQHLQREGMVLVGLAAAEAGRMYRSTLWKFSLGAGSSGGKSPPSTAQRGRQSPHCRALPYHKFRPGASVIITPHVEVPGAARRVGGGGGSVGDGGGDGGQGLDANPETGLPIGGVEGVVVEAHREHLMVALEGRAHEQFHTMVAAAVEFGTANSRTTRSLGGGTRGGGGSGGGGGVFQGWRLDQSVRDTTTRRHLEGIRRLGVWTEAQGEARLGEARVRAVLVGSRSAAVLAAEPPVWVKEDRWREDARTALAAQQGLNDSQRRAVAAALTRTVTLWQGPPGTGKTRTLLALIEVLVRVRRTGGMPSSSSITRTPSTAVTYRPRAAGGGGGGAAASVSAAGRVAAMGPVLAVADTNAAVDNLVEGLEERGVVVVRLGPAAKARDSLRHLSLEAQAESTPLGRKAVALRTQALAKQERWRQSAVGRTTRSDGDVASLAMDAEVRADLDRSEVMLREAATGVVAAVEVVVATCTSAGDSIMDGRPWRCVVVDEASQATEPSVLVALTRGSAFVVMAGDPRQLPPTVLSEEALQYGLDVTLFERVAMTGGVTPMLLDMQYRMHPAISAFPCAYFYGGKLRDGVGAQDKPTPRGFPWPNAAKPLAVVAVLGGREETSGGLSELAAAGPKSAAAGAAATGAGAKGDGASGATAGGALLLPRGKKGSGGALEVAAVAAAPKSTDRASYRNSVEALLALAVTQRLLAAGDISSAAILTPYRGQVRLVEALARQQGLEAAWQTAGLEVCVSTVDGYQGREADVVVFSAVRSNERGAVGFLSDPRRMNVAITRPRRGLVVLGETNTLTRGSADWAMYIKWARSQGVLITDSDVIDVDSVLQRRPNDSSSATPALTTNDDDEDEEGVPIAVDESSARMASSRGTSAAHTFGSSDPRDGRSLVVSGRTSGGGRSKKVRKQDRSADAEATTAVGDAESIAERATKGTTGISRRFGRTRAAEGAAAAAVEIAHAALSSSELEEFEDDDVGR